MTRYRVLIKSGSWFGLFLLCTGLWFRQRTLAGSKTSVVGQLETGPVVWSACAIRTWTAGSATLSFLGGRGSREAAEADERLCRENADKEPFYTGTEAPSAPYVGGLRDLLRITRGGVILLESERERQDDKWILLEPLGDKQIGDSVELGDADLQHQQHGLVSRGDGTRLPELSRLTEWITTLSFCSGVRISRNGRMTTLKWTSIWPLGLGRPCEP